MTSQAYGPGSLEALFDIEAALADNSVARPATLSTEADWERNVAVNDLAKIAMYRLAGKSIEDQNAKPIVSDRFVGAFCRVLMSGKMRAAMNMTRACSARGANYGDIAEDLFAPAGRRMGDKWTNDTASLVDVNIGISTLIRTNIAFCSGAREPAVLRGGTAIFASFQGQAHTLGLSFATEHFRRNGWSVRYMPATTPSDLLDAAAVERPDMVGMTAAIDAELNQIEDVVGQLRTAPIVPRIMVGGNAPSLTALNVNAVASSLDAALVTAQAFIL